MKELSDIFQPVYFRHEIAEIEKSASVSLMEKAGLAAAEFVREHAKGNRVLVLAGPGNNGGDAFHAACHLKSWWFEVTLVFAGDPGKLSGDASIAYRLWADSGGHCLGAIPGRIEWDIVLDGLFGTGLNRMLSDEYRRLIDAVNALELPVVSIDMPSGVCSDTGRVFGAAVVAAYTLTFIALKPGLLTSDGLDHCGAVHVDSLGISPVAVKRPEGWLSNAQIVRSRMGKRQRNSHKGLFGSTAVIGGAPGMLGAALLAGRAALKLGSGKVMLGLLSEIAVDIACPEIMVRDAGGSIGEESAALVVGPGLGRSDRARELLDMALLSGKPLVLDADALNLLSGNAGLQRMLKQRKAFSILTPHPAEAARLLGCTTGEIQSDRIASAKRMAEQFGCPVVLKGAGSLCAFPQGHWVINASGNPGLAQAGMGDVLSGMIGAFLAQGLEAESALICAVHLHGAAADMLAEAGIGPVGMSASEITDSARVLLNRLLYR